MNYLKLLCLSALGGLLGGCAPVSSQMPGRAIPSLIFADLQSHPEKYQGQMFILGGLVMSVQPHKNGSLLWVDQRPLDTWNRPLRNAASGGSFAVESDQWLPSYSYAPQREVTVAGVVEGKMDKGPLLKAREITLGEYEPWEEWYYPIPRHWYDYDPRMEFWYTPPYFDPRRRGRN
ncbi:MAG: hypothetical protein FJ126_09135 [Deltaproteobacteria bacterium]|nr:hypothetical protein [Deltaproteobacteria bacterium]